MCNDYRLLQLTNSSIPALPTATLLPVGIPTRKIVQSSTCKDTFTVTTNVNNTIYINEEGFYKITYTGYLTAAAAGNVIVNLQLNGVNVLTATETAVINGTVPINISFVTRVYCNCACNSTNMPILVELLNNGVDLTGGNSNLIIERISD